MVNDTRGKEIQITSFKLWLQLMVPYKKGDIGLIEKVQKRATKLIPTIRSMA